MVQQRCQWSAEKAGVTSGREAARGAPWLVLKETDRQFFDPRISHTLENIADEETEID